MVETGPLSEAHPARSKLRGPKRWQATALQGATPAWASGLGRLVGPGVELLDQSVELLLEPPEALLERGGRVRRCRGSHAAHHFAHRGLGQGIRHDGAGGLLLA